MGKTCIAIRHIHFEDLGSFAQPIEDAGYAITYVDAARSPLNQGELLDADLVAFLGGPIGVYDEDRYPFLGDELRAAQARLDRAAPSLGICLGAQIIARAAGANVYPGARGKEIGWHPITLTQEAAHGAVGALADPGEPTPMFHWHGDTFDLPEGAIRMAGSERYPNQVFSIQDHTLAFQCHPEIDPSRVQEWLVGHAHELGASGEDPDIIRQETARYGESLSGRSRAVIARWLGSL